MTTSQFTTVDPSFQSEERTRSYYRWRAGGYDKVTTYEIEHHREAIQLADIQPGDRVLEVACGTGRATVELASRLGADGRLDALDLSEAMLGHAQRKVAERGLLNKVELKIGSAQVLPYPSQTFDILYNSYMFDLIAVTQFKSILEEFKRVLKPGGKMILVNMSKDTSRKTLYERVYEIARLFPCRPVAMESYVREAGFADAQRIYRNSYTRSMLLPFGTEIVTARKALKWLMVSK
ncbi:MAG TPA: class I SAM-dependent methyltransferase [Anaerolineales bacterium]|nr:class I SAM-dependent methyltransferase [Anaerolineales bacterium]